MTGAAAASYEWAVSADGKDWSVVETEDDETFGVTADLLGMYVKVTVTAEDGETASDVTTEKVAENEEFGEIEIVSAEATAANEITVTLANSVISSDTTIEVKKGTSTIDVTDTWNSTFDEVVLTTAANLSAGTYAVTLTSETDETNTDTATFEVTGRYVKEIVIDVDTALTDPNDKKIAYAHYDVLDNYGESVRNSTSIMWAGSATITGDKTTGKLTITKTNNNDWVYNEQIYVTGVYAKTGVSVQKTLTVGSQQALNSLEIAGFVKKGTTEIVKTLPAGFQNDTYYILFNALDQNGTQMKVGTVNGDDITFVSDNVLVVKEIKKPLKAGGLTVNGVEYEAAFVEPGIKVSEGGAVTVTAIANKTGNKTEIAMIVGIDAVVASFTLSSPSVIVADGDTDVEIPFTALDKDGNQITKFDTLAKQETFNTLSFTASEGTLKLAEQDDGTAKLLWSDKEMLWTNGQTTDGIDRPISLTVVVVGGGTDNEMISVSDKRRPDGIIAAAVDEAYTEKATITIYGGDGSDTNPDPDTGAETGSFESFQFVDQYGKTIKGTDADEKYGDSTGFFAQSERNNTVFSDSDLKGHVFAVRAIYAGSGNIKCSQNLTGSTTVIGDSTTAANHFAKQAVIRNGNALTFQTQNVESAATGEGFKFEIAKTKEKIAADTATDWEASSPSRYVETAVVDLSQIKSFTIGDLNKFYAGKNGDWTAKGQVASGKAGTGAGKLNDATDTQFNAAAITGGLTSAAAADKDYKQEVKVTGKWNGKDVAIPKTFFKVTGNKISTGAAGTEALNDNVVDTILDGLKVQDLYDKSSAMGVSKDASDTLKVTLYNKESSDFVTDAGGILAAPLAYNDLVNNSAEIVATWTDTNITDADSIAAAAASIVVEKVIPSGTTVTAAEVTLAAAKAAIEAVGTDVGDGTLAQKADLKTAINGKAPKATVAAQGGTTDVAYPIYDTASIKVTISDQDSKASVIEGLEESYTIAPDTTVIDNDDLLTALGVSSGDVVVKNQYGVTLTGAVITYRATNIAENKDAYALNNFTVSGNDTAAIAFTGLERGDTFDLVLSSGAASATTTITVGADKLANITGDKNNYLDELLDLDGVYDLTALPRLEKQRKDGLS